ncbi:hypothetical protein [Peribacillus loiseleuriae]|uniref:hypothetical protein n=1 Tax=Peribacillus loiseleuriae TaxID=1679170 RepID=UPI00069DD99B|nr:hypothetical protein [Peribacillus loiseleuriae]
MSYVFGHSNNNLLVFQTIKLAITALKPGEHPLIHSELVRRIDSINSYIEKESLLVLFLNKYNLKTEKGHYDLAIRAFSRGE